MKTQKTDLIGWKNEMAWWKRLIAQVGLFFSLLAGGLAGVPLIGSWPGYASDVVVANGHAYLWGGLAGLQILDISDPADPQLVGGDEQLGRIDDVAVSGNLLALSIPEIGLKLFDISNPSVPQLLGEYSTHVPPERWGYNPGEVLAIHGNVLFYIENDGYPAYNGSNGLELIDISDPRNPVLVTRLFPDRAVYSFAIQNELLFVSLVRDRPLGPILHPDAADILVLNLDDPLNPRQVGEYVVEGWNLVHVVPISDRLIGFQFAYPGDGFQAPTLHIVDFSDLENPTLVNSIPIEDEDSYHHAVTSYKGLVFQPEFDRVRVFDPLSQVLRLYYFQCNGAPQMVFEGDYALAASGEQGLQIFDLSPLFAERSEFFELEKLEILGEYDTVGYCRDVALSGSYAFVADGFGLQVIEVSNPANPQWVGAYDTSGSAIGVAVSGNYAYVADRDSGLQIIDISNPANPQWVGGYDTSGYAIDVAVSGNLAYVADGATGLQIVDVSNRANPQWAGGYEAVGEADGVVVSGNHAFVGYSQSASEGGLEVLDIGNPAAPASVGVIGGLGAAYGVTLAGNHVYVASSQGLHVIDVSNPAAPARVGGDATIGSIYDVAVADTYAYVVNPAFNPGNPVGLLVLDVSDPKDPHVVAGNSSFSAWGVTVDGDKVYVAAGQDGLIILNQYVELRIGPAVVSQGGQIRLPVKGADGQCVCVQRSTDLVHWEDWKTMTLDADGCELADDIASGQQMFYRVVEDHSMPANEP